jgi:cold shock CspA family protein
MSYSSSPAQSASQSDNFLGQVKWFNARAGFGYITVMEGDRKGEDVFVHHSAINVGDRMYKYLVQGEYVGFQIGKSQSTTHEFQVETVGGLGDNGKLMCETRLQNQRARPRAPMDGQDQQGQSGRGGGGGGRGGGRVRANRATPRRENGQQTTQQEVTVDEGLN